MPVNRAEKTFFDLLIQRERQKSNMPLSLKSIDVFRQDMVLFKEFSGPHTSAPFQERFLAVRDAYMVPIRIYNYHLIQKTSVMIFFIGNGYVADLFEINCIAVSRIAKYSNCKIIVVNTRLAPEFPLPTAIYDAYDVSVQIAQNHEYFNIDTDKIYIGGICSGAHCAAVIANLVKQKKSFKISHQILVNGYYDLSNSCLNFLEFEKEDKMVNRSVISYLASHYGISSFEMVNPLFSPYLEQDLFHLPPTTFIVSEYDGVRGDSEAYYEKMIKFNNNTKKIVLLGQTHNTFLLRKAMNDREDPAQTIADEILEIERYSH